MTKNQEFFLAVLKHFSHPEETVPDGGMLSGKDWMEVLHLASLHAVLPPVFEHAWNAEGFLGLPAEIQDEYKQKSKKLVAMQMQSTAFFLEYYKRLCGEDSGPLVMKGIICREMYPIPDYRVSSDEDLLVKREEFPELEETLLDCGFVKEREEEAGMGTPRDPDTDGEMEGTEQSLDELHEVTFLHPRAGLRLEVHLSLFPESSESYGRFNREFEDVFERSSVREIREIPVYTLGETQHMLYLLLHGLKHFLHSGFGIRQLCDMTLFAERFGGRIDWKEVEECARRQDFYVFWMNLFDIGERYLGFSWERAGLARPPADILDSGDMLEDMLASGIYGKSSPDRLHSANMTLQASSRMSGRRSGVMASLFPGYDYMVRRYPWLLERKWLLPAAWLKRIAAYRREIKGRSVMGAAKTGKQRVELLKKYRIIK